MTDKTTVTPMMAQYFAIKENYQDCLLFYRLGDFYELFYDDAKVASEALEITLTSRNKNSENPVPMCGVPHHSSAEYIKTLVEKGYRVAICEQLEDAKLTKGMVKRDVVQVITPGTMLEATNQEDKQHHYLAAIQYDTEFSLAYADVITGELKVTSLKTLDELITELGSIDVKEIVYQKEIDERIQKRLSTQFSFVYSRQDKVEDLADFENLLHSVSQDDQLHVVSILLSYIMRTQKRHLIHLQPVKVYSAEHYLKLDYNAKSNLELVESSRTRSKKGSLLWLLDETKTAMGGRMLKLWIEKPLIQRLDIEARQKKVKSLMNHYFERIDLIQALKSIYDLERLVARVSFGSASPRDLVQLKVSLEQIPAVKDYLHMMNEQSDWQDVLTSLPDLSSVIDMIDRAIVDEPPISFKEGGIIKEGYHDVLDTYKDAMKNGKQWIALLQQQEREKTGIKTLKIGYNRVFGYYIEITKGQLQSLPEGQYERKQTLANAERFITPELKEKERIILEAEEKSLQLEYELFTHVREQVKTHSQSLQQMARLIAELDVLQSFATVSEQNHYTCPTFNTATQNICIENGRHPVVEKVIGIDQYVPNGLTMLEDNHILLITGPNMSGKSTFMRQLALIVVMAQIGCFVPATHAELPIFDRIFTRIGAADDLISGQSTFMVEMSETNQAIQYATKNSLLLFDEIGRGTATYDGMALAEAILRYVHKHVQAKALFSTHYHELTALDQSLKGLRNMHVGAVEQDGQLIFLHQLKEGPVDKSYGLHVAQLAGLPQELIEDAQVILNQLEQTVNKVPEESGSGAVVTEQLSLFDTVHSDVVAQLKTLSLNNMTPLEVMQVVSKWQQELNEQ